MRDVIAQRPGAALLGMGAMFLAVDTWGHVTRAYVTSPIIDIVTHILFGGILALLLMRSGMRRYLYIFGIVMLTGLAWELFEFVYDVYVAAPRGFTLAQHGPGDTIKDIVDNGIGAAAALYLFRPRA